MIEKDNSSGTGKAPNPYEKDTDTFLTGANIDETQNEIQIDSLENS